MNKIIIPLRKIIGWLFILGLIYGLLHILAITNTGYRKQHVTYWQSFAEAATIIGAFAGLIIALGIIILILRWCFDSDF